MLCCFSHAVSSVSFALLFRRWSSSSRETSADKGECRPRPVPGFSWRPLKIWPTSIRSLVGHTCCLVNGHNSGRIRKGSRRIPWWFKPLANRRNHTWKKNTFATYGILLSSNQGLDAIKKRLCWSHSTYPCVLTDLSLPVIPRKVPPRATRLCAGKSHTSCDSTTGIFTTSFLLRSFCTILEVKEMQLLSLEVRWLRSRWVFL